MLHFLINTVQAVSLPEFSKTSDLPAFISSVYSFALTIVGIAVFIRILYGGFLLLTAAGNTAKVTDARDKIKNAVIGAILLFAAYLILYVINPDLVSNAFKFTIPGASRPSVPAAESVSTGPTAGQAVISGMVGAGGVGVKDGKSVSFYSLPIARAQEGIYVFTVKVTDRNGDICRETYNIEVVPNVAALKTQKYSSVAEKYSASLLNPVRDNLGLKRKLGTIGISNGVNAVNAQEVRAETTGASFRYLKVESTSGSWIAWREIKIYDGNNQEIKPVNATVTSQWCTAADQKAVPQLCPAGATDCCNPPNVYDGNENTLWNSGGQNSDGSVRKCLTYFPQSMVCMAWAPQTAWIKLDLGEVKNISKIRLLTENSPNPVQASHKLLISSDGVNFSSIHEFSGNISSNTWLGYQVPPTSSLDTAGTQDKSDIKETIQSGGCVIGTKILPDAIVGTPYYAEIYAAGEAPFVYEIEEGSLPGGLSIVAVLDMPVLTIKNMTAQRTPPTAFKVGEIFRLELINAKPNSAVYFKWFKNGVPWFYPGKTPNSAGWTAYATTDGNGEWVNEAAFTANEIGVWQEYVMVDGKVSRVLEFQVLAPEVKIVVSAPAPGTGMPVYSGGGGGGCAQTPFRCENKETGATSDLLTEDEIRACSADKSGDVRLVWPECVYSEHSASRAACAQYDFEARNCWEQSSGLAGDSGTFDKSGLPYSADGSPPADVQAGSLYTADQYVGDIRLGGNNLLVKCRYSDQIAAVSCGAMSSGEYCLPDGRNAGWNETWCAGKTDASGKIINPTPAPTPTPVPTPTPAREPTPTPIPRGGETEGRGR